MSGSDILDSKADVYALADVAEVIVQGYAFFDRGDSVTIINLHKPNEFARFYNNELIETNMDDQELHKMLQVYNRNKEFL